MKKFVLVLLAVATVVAIKVFGSEYEYYIGE